MPILHTHISHAVKYTLLSKEEIEVKTLTDKKRGTSGIKQSISFQIVVIRTMSLCKNRRVLRKAGAWRSNNNVQYVENNVIFEPQTT